MEVWAQENDPEKSWTLMDYLLCDDGNRFRAQPALSIRDWEVANTLIQWLGSPVGQSFLDEVTGNSGDCGDSDGQPA